MNRSRLLWTFLFVDFAVLTGWALYEVGYMGVLQAAMAGPGSIQIFVDLVIAVGICFVFIWPDARARGINPTPYLILAAFLGSFGPLAYLIRRSTPSGSLA